MRGCIYVQPEGKGGIREQGKKESIARMTETINIWCRETELCDETRPHPPKSSP